MVKGLLIAAVATIASGFLGVIYEITGKKRYNIFEFMIYIQGFGLLFGLALTVALHLPLLDRRLFFLACVGSVTYLITLGAYLMATRERDIGANWSILHLSVAVPVVFSIVYFHDRFTTMKGIGLALVVVAVVVIGGGSKKRSAEKLSLSWAMYITVAFLMNGWAAVIFRFVPKKSAPLFTLYFYGLTFFAVLSRKLFVRGWPTPGLMLAGLGGAAAQWTGVVMTIIALGRRGKSPGGLDRLSNCERPWHSGRRIVGSVTASSADKRTSVGWDCVRPGGPPISYSLIR
jgi:uncharacterized membrane protein